MQPPVEAKLGEPLSQGRYQLYVTHEMVIAILQDLYTRHARIVAQFDDSAFSSSATLIETLTNAEFDRVADGIADLSRWLEQQQLAIYAHLTNLIDVPLYGAEPLPLPPPPPPVGPEETLVARHAPPPPQRLTVEDRLLDK